MTYETSGMTVFKEVDGKLAVVANFEQGMDDDMHALVNSAALLEALEAIASTVICNGDMSITYAIDGAARKQMHEAIHKARG